jgi:hypothetical protein
MRCEDRDRRISRNRAALGALFRRAAGDAGVILRIISSLQVTGNPLLLHRGSEIVVSMRKLFYAGGHVIVSDQVCKAILRYSRALAKAEAVDLVIFPGLTDDNQRGMIHILIGPVSQLLSVPVEDLGIDLNDAQMVEILESRTKNLDPNRPEWGKDVVDVEDLTTFDWDF